MKDHFDNEFQAVSISQVADTRQRSKSMMLLQGLPGSANRFSTVPRNAPVNPVSVSSAQTGWYAAWGKRALDLVLVLATLPVTVPIVLICAALLWIEGGTPFYRQARIGRNGDVFSMLKLRSMVADADASLSRLLEQDLDLRREWETTQKLKNDPRVTRIGALLRATSLDELPQFWNVLRGEMSLVGPRPMMPDQLPIYGDPQDYFALMPGLTGVWQVSARNESSFAYRATIDSAYRRSMSLAGDIGLMIKTVGVVVRRTGY